MKTKDDLIDDIAFQISEYVKQYERKRAREFETGDIVELDVSTDYRFGVFMHFSQDIQERCAILVKTTSGMSMIYVHEGAIVKRLFSWEDIPTAHSYFMTYRKVSSNV